MQWLFMQHISDIILNYSDINEFLLNDVLNLHICYIAKLFYSSLMIVLLYVW